MNAEIISIGTELLLGHIANTNTAFLSQRLAEIGIDVYNTSVVGDNPSRLTKALRQALLRSDIIITTGGMGPTVDDITIETVATVTGRQLILNKIILNDLKNYFRLRKAKFPSDNIRQALIPEDAKWIRNKVGTAPGLIIEHREKIIICLPGPPRELEPIFTGKIMPYLVKSFKLRQVIITRTIKITGGTESLINNKVKDLLTLKPPTTVGIYAKLGEVDLKIMSKTNNYKDASMAIQKLEYKIRARFKDRIFGCDEETLESAVGGILMTKNKRIAVAESCTGGLVANRLTDISGSSKYFVMGVIAYSDEIKKNILCVEPETLRRFGAVSREVASGMACGIRLLAGADIGIGITGIAGPSGGTRVKPVGLVYIALASDKRIIVKEARFKGSREEIKFQASQAALDLVRRSV